MPPPRELTDEEVFGRPSGRSRELTDDEVFGAQTTGRTAAPREGELSDEEVFGAHRKPKTPPVEWPAPPVPQPEPGLWDYTKEVGKQLAQGAVESAVAGRLKGIGAYEGKEVTPQEQQQIWEAEYGVPQGIQPRIEPGGVRKVTPVTESPLYQAGEWVSRKTQEALQPRDILHPVVRDVASAVGSIGGNILTSALPGGLVTLPFQGVGEAAERAIKSGATPEQQREAARRGIIAGVSEFADVLLPMFGSTGKLLGFLGKVGTQTVMGRVAKAAAAGATTEGIQEGFQQWVQNLIKQGVYDPTQDVWEDVPYQAMIGAIAGGGVAAIAGRGPELPPAPPAPPPGATPPVAAPPPVVETAPAPAVAAAVAAAPAARVPRPEDAPYDFINNWITGEPGVTELEPRDVARHLQAQWPNDFPDIAANLLYLRDHVRDFRQSEVDEGVPAAGSRSEWLLQTYYNKGPPTEAAAAPPQPGQFTGRDPITGLPTTTGVNLPPDLEGLVPQPVGVMATRPAEPPPDLTDVRPGRPDEPVPVPPEPTVPPGAPYPAWSIWQDVKDIDWGNETAMRLPVGPQDITYLRAKGIPIGADGAIDRPGFEALRQLAAGVPGVQGPVTAERTGPHTPQSSPQMLNNPIVGGVNDALSIREEEVRGTESIDREQVAALLGASRYTSSPDQVAVTVKELLQNAADHTRPLIEAGQMDNGRISIDMDPLEEVITVTDDGLGMTPETLVGPFLKLGGSAKEAVGGREGRFGGGFGIAKMLTIYGSKWIDVLTMRDGKMFRLNETGDRLRAWMADPGNPSLQPIARPVKITRELANIFPKGHGTQVKIRVPSEYWDPSTERNEYMPFPVDIDRHRSLLRSPLFTNIDVVFDGNLVMNMGTTFPANQYKPVANVDMKWGRVRVYASNDPVPDFIRYTTSDNAHVLSNGLWQFDTEVKKDPTKWGGGNVPYRFYIDVDSKVKPSESGYPFELNRQQFTKSAAKDFQPLFNYLSAFYRLQLAQQDVVNYGDIEQLTTDAQGRLQRAQSMKLQPTAPQQQSPLTTLAQGKVEIIDGVMKINGVEIPITDSTALRNFFVDYKSLKIDQKLVNPRAVSIIDGVNVVFSPAQTETIVTAGRNKFGQRFDEHLFNIGRLFIELRDAVAMFNHRGRYDGLRDVAVGLFFEPGVNGVHITIPFRGVFLNPASTTFGPSNDPAKIGMRANRMITTMVHELSHFAEMNHDATRFIPEMQDINAILASSRTFNLFDFQNRFINALNQNLDIDNWLGGLYSGAVTLQLRGNRLEGVSENTPGDGSVPSDGARAGSTGGLPAGVGAEPQAGAPALGGQPVGPGISATTGPGRPADGGRAANQRAIDADGDPGVDAVPIQPETLAARESANNLFGGPGKVPQGIKTAASHADRMNWIFKYFAGIDQLRKANPYFRPLINYVSKVHKMFTEETHIQDAAVQVGRKWKRLWGEGDRLSLAMSEIVNMSYRSDIEVRRGLVRHPSQQELDKIFQKHRIGPKGQEVYNNIQFLMNWFLDETMRTAVARMTSRGVSQKIIAETIQGVQDLKQRPFFPFLHFGEHYVALKDPNGNLIHFETMERTILRSARSRQKARRNELSRDFAQKFGRMPAQDEIIEGLLPPSAASLLGMPQVLLNEMKDALLLTPEQINSIHMFAVASMQGKVPVLDPKFQRRHYVPSYSMMTPGYSLDFRRAFAKYMFHGSKYLSKVKYADALKEDVRTAQSVPGVTENYIARYMDDHLTNTILDAKGDFGLFKGAAFLWAMGYVPAAATQNLSQIPMVSYPWLSAKFGGLGFGDARAVKALGESMTQLSSFYRRASYEGQTEFEYQALEYGVKTGRITETQAPEIAGMSQGAGLLKGIGGNRAEAAAVFVQEKAAWMFEMAEQFNRRVTYRAALKLAMRYPQAQAVKEATELHKDEVANLMARGFTQLQANAMVTAANAVDETQFTYSRWARPRFMRGPFKGTVFIFKKYIQSLLFMLAQNPWDVLPRYLLMAALIGGLRGLPGMEDFIEALKGATRLIYGKGFDLEKEARKWALEMFDGTVPPDLITQGFARRGLGIPWLMDMIGSFFTGRPGRGLDAPRTGPGGAKSGFGQNVPYPVFDRSRALTVGQILPVNIGALMAPPGGADKVIAEQTQRGLGAVFGVGFNMYKFLFDSNVKWADAKSWERVIPRELAALSKGFRAFREGRERSKGGPAGGTTVISYDPNDTEQMMEALGLAMGYQPLRLQARWDSIIAQMESDRYFDLRRRKLMEEFYEVQQGGRRDAIQDAVKNIRDFNRDLPKEARGKAIEPENLERSYERRVEGRIARESGTPLREGSVPIARETQRLYPESTVDVRPVRPQ